MGIFFFFLFLFALFVLFAPFVITRFVLKATLGCYRDKTSAAAAAGVRRAATICGGLGLTLCLVFINYCGGLSSWVAGLVGVVLFSQWFAIALPLRVKGNPSAAVDSEVGFTRF